MAIAGTPSQFFTTQGNGQVALQWAIEAGALSYSVQRSTDGINFTVIATPNTISYLDTTVTLGTPYYYQVASVNASGTSPYTPPQTIVPTPSGEMCLSQIRLAAQQRADRVNSEFVTLPEWNSYINQAMFELYDLLVTAYEDYFVASPISFVADGNQFLFPLPNGSNTFLDNAGATVVASPFYKLLGVDLALNTANNAYVTINKFNFIDRNKFVYPNTASTIYGVFNLRYRLMGSNIEFIPTPSAGQKIRLWYMPRLQQLLQETDITTIGISGWLEYVIVRAAMYALAKEESDTSTLAQQLIFLKDRIESSAVNRDAGQPDTISDVRSNGYGNGGSGGWNGSSGGWALAFPGLMSNYQTNHALSNTVSFAHSLLGYATLSISLAYFFYLNRGHFGSGVAFSWVRNLSTSGISSLTQHIGNIFTLSPQKKVFRINTSGVITRMANAKANSYRTFENLIGHPVCEYPSEVKLQTSSPISDKTSHPKPASFSFKDEFIKLIDQFHVAIKTYCARGVK